jgi:hypothetical protein
MPRSRPANPNGNPDNHIEMNSISFPFPNLSIGAEIEFGLKIEKIELCILYELVPKAL